MPERDGVHNDVPEFKEFGIDSAGTLEVLLIVYAEEKTRKNAMALAEAYQLAGNLVEALKYCREALDIIDEASLLTTEIMQILAATFESPDKKNQEVAIQIGEALLEKEETPELIRLVSKLYLAGYNNRISFDDSPKAQLVLKMLQQRIKSLNTHALSYNPDDLEAKINVADMDLGMGYHEAAKTAYEEILEKDPRCVTALLGIALYYIFSEKRDPSSALQYLQEIAKIDPQHPQFVTLLRNVLSEILQACLAEVNFTGLPSTVKKKADSTDVRKPN